MLDFSFGLAGRDLEESDLAELFESVELLVLSGDDWALLLAPSDDEVGASPSGSSGGVSPSDISGGVLPSGISGGVPLFDMLGGLPFPGKDAVWFDLVTLL